MIRVLFVCLGNICRSPMAQGVFELRAGETGLDGLVEADSAGTGAYHVGEPPDDRAQMESARRGIDLSRQRARAVSDDDFDRFDYIVAMDASNLSVLEGRCPENRRVRIHRLMDFTAELGVEDVPDPYWGGGQGFSRVLDLVEAGVGGLIDHLRREHDLN